MADDYGFGLSGLGVGDGFGDVVDVFDFEVFGDVEGGLTVFYLEIVACFVGDFFVGEARHLEVVGFEDGGLTGGGVEEGELVFACAVVVGGLLDGVLTVGDAGVLAGCLLDLGGVVGGGIDGWGAAGGADDSEEDDH